MAQTYGFWKIGTLNHGPGSQVVPIYGVLYFYHSSYLPFAMVQVIAKATTSKPMNVLIVIVAIGNYNYKYYNNDSNYICRQGKIHTMECKHGSQMRIICEIKC